MQSMLLGRLKVSKCTLVTATSHHVFGLVALLMLHDPNLDPLACTPRYLRCGCHSVKAAATQNFSTIQGACIFMLWAPS